jgi:hypothetical protein
MTKIKENVENIRAIVDYVHFFPSCSLPDKVIKLPAWLGPLRIRCGGILA